ncbi:MAG: hypothetical protein AAB974_01805 [Patescibacteria group bacterium]
MQFMTDKKQIALIAITVLVLLFSFLFYWFQIRPEGIRKYCWQFASAKYPGFGELLVGVIQAKFDNTYIDCLRQHGMK